MNASAPEPGRILRRNPDLAIPFTGGVLRPWREADIESLVRHADDPAVARNLGDRFPHPYTRADAEWWVAHARSDETRELALAIELEEVAVGGMGLEFRADPVFRRTCEIGYWIARAHWGRGHMTAAVRALSEWAFERLELERIEAGVFEWNSASARVLEKAGYELEARLKRSVVKEGRVIDRLLYARFRGP